MKLQILCIGKVKDSYNQNEIEDVVKRMKRAGNTVEIMEYPDIRIPENLREDGRKAFVERECERMLQYISHEDYVIALCIEGKEISTEEHRRIVQKAIANEYKTITYLIGGSLGLSDAVKHRADFKLSFSKMTFPHQLMRVVLLEEVERIFL